MSAPATTPYPGNSWYLVKRGLYYRPKAAGYTDQITEAGVFSEAEASDHVRGTAGEKDARNRVSMVRVPKANGATETDCKTKYTALLAEVEALRLKVAKADADDDALIRERDEAEDAADKLASLVLGEDIDWPDHQAKWAEAIEEGAAIKTLQAEVEALRGALLECIVSIEHRAPREEMECTVERARLALAPRSAEEPGAGAKGEG
jgi:hypothetical protein